MSFNEVCMNWKNKMNEDEEKDTRKKGNKKEQTDNSNEPADEKEILKVIMNTLSEHDLSYKCDENNSQCLEINLQINNKPTKIHILLQTGKVIYRLSFPYLVQANAIAVFALHMARFNLTKAFTMMNLDMHDGEITLVYVDLLADPKRFDKEEFWIYMNSLIHVSLEEYVKLAHLSMGVVSDDDKEIYKILLRNSLKTLEGNFPQEQVVYGTYSIEETLSGDKITFREKKREKEDEDDPDDSDDLFDFDFLRDDDSKGKMKLSDDFIRTLINRKKSVENALKSDNDNGRDNKSNNENSRWRRRLPNPELSEEASEDNKVSLDEDNDDQDVSMDDFLASIIGTDKNTEGDGADE